MFIIPELKKLADDLFSIGLNLDCFQGEEDQDKLAEEINKLSEKVQDIIYFLQGE